MKRATVTVVCAIGGWIAPVSADAPKVSLVSSSWQLGFIFHDPQRISLVLPGDDRPTMFWYMLYQVNNGTPQEVQFYPLFRIVTDTLKVVEGGESISPCVYDAIVARHKKEFPFLKLPWKITGPLLRGEENTQTSVVVFRQFDREASGFTVYVGGLSGEIQRVRNPGFLTNQEESATNPRVFLFRRTLAIKYDLPGDPDTQARAVPIRRSREWVMR